MTSDQGKYNTKSKNVVVSPKRKQVEGKKDKPKDKVILRQTSHNPAKVPDINTPNRKTLILAQQVHNRLLDFMRGIKNTTLNSNKLFDMGNAMYMMRHLQMEKLLNSKSSVLMNMSMSNLFQNMMTAETHICIDFMKDNVALLEKMPELTVTEKNSDQGEYGYVMVEKRKGMSKIYKQPSKWDKLCYKTIFCGEAIFGLCVGNEIRKDGYHFVPQTYNFISNVNHLSIGNKIQLLYNVDVRNTKPVIIQEYIDNSFSFNDFVNHFMKIHNDTSVNISVHHITVYTHVMLQILGFIRLFRKKWNGTHNDLHAKNILVQHFDDEQTVYISPTHLIKTHNVVRIIDFGMATFQLGDQFENLLVDSYSAIFGCKTDLLQSLVQHNHKSFDVANFTIDDNYFCLDNMFLTRYLNDYKIMTKYDNDILTKNDAIGRGLDIDSIMDKLIERCNETIFESNRLNQTYFTNGTMVEFIDEKVVNHTCYLQTVIDNFNSDKLKFNIKLNASLFNYELKHIIAFVDETLKKGNISDILYDLMQLKSHLKAIEHCLSYYPDDLKVMTKNNLDKCTTSFKIGREKMKKRVGNLFDMF
ncbi:MAG: hypothetical protein K0U78_20985 [Actinomycetia bacterium]|nr:hypothetical protein [Actinomycetes bacterium]